MFRARASILACSLMVLACSGVEPSGEEGGVTTDPSGSGMSTVDPSDTEGDSTGPTTSTGTSTSTSTTGEPILDFGGGTGVPSGPCTSDAECLSGHCYIVPFLGGFCGECTEDADCPDGGCTAPNPFDSTGPICNMGELGAGCESDAVCQGGLVCEQALDLLGLITLNTCGACHTDIDCAPGEICVADVEFSEFTGAMRCVLPGSLGQDGYCDLEGNGAEACASGICSTIDIMGLAEIGACGSCDSDADCDFGTCIPGEFILDTGQLRGSTCG